jgi:DNA-binding NtrC family response regulator
VKPRILVVEDLAALAYALCDLIADAGFEVVGPVAKVSEALALIDDGCDAALVDYRLADGTAESILAKLQDRDLPFAVLSGSDDLPGSCRAHRFLTKPVRAAEVIDMVRTLQPRA